MPCSRLLPRACNVGLLHPRYTRIPVQSPRSSQGFFNQLPTLQVLVEALQVQLKVEAEVHGRPSRNYQSDELRTSSS